MSLATVTTYTPPEPTSRESTADPSSTMSDDETNAWISWGRCFFDNSGDESPSRYIPCGNNHFGHIPCCESGDMCLSSGACYNGQYGITYLSGCTDQSYKDKSCPAKGAYSDDTWVGLAYCNGTSNEWVACKLNRGTNTVTKAKACYCPQTSRTVAIHDASRLADIVSLGTATGESITWMGGNLPDTATLTPTSLLVSGSGPASDPSPNPTDSSPPIAATTESNWPAATSDMSAGEEQSEASNLGPGAKAGIGVGAGVGSIALAAALFALFRRHKRKKNLDGTNHTQQPSARPVTLYNDSDIHDDDLRSPAWSGHKSELDAVGTASPSPRYGEFSRPQSEVEGSPVTGTAGRPLTNGGYEMAGKTGPVYEMPA